MHNRAIIHGCLVEIDGVGVLIVGDSDVGKTTVCLDLERLGYTFIADDAVLIRRINSEICGSAPPETAGRIATRDDGVVKHIERGSELSCSVNIIVELVADHESLPELPLDEMLKPITLRRFSVNESTAKQIEAFALKLDRSS